MGAVELRYLPREACCGVLVPSNLPEAFHGQDVLWFVDDEAALAVDPRTWTPIRKLFTSRSSNSGLECGLDA